MKQAHNYNYFVINLSEDGEEAYQAIVPKFPGMLIFGDPPDKLHEAVIFSIEEAIESYKKAGKPLPPPDAKPKNDFKGKIVLRTTPEIHQKLYYEAQAHQMSLNKYINSKLAG